MRITRHYLTVKGRRVHYRRCGEGPPVLLVHQSPRSSAEYEGVMRQWGRHFTCLAPDSPGFGQSAPFAVDRPTTEDYADAVLDFAEAVGLEGIAAYGFHSGGIFLMNAMRRHPDRFVALAVGGYPCFRPEELSDVGEAYLPSFVPMPYGEHLVWAWNRLLEQSWYFPWYLPDDRRRMSLANADPVTTQAMVMDLLTAGDAYRDGYRAALTADYDVPPAGTVLPPALLASYTGDPMTAHMARFPALPDGWATAEQPSRDAHFAACAEFLAQHPAPAVPLAEDAHRGFIAVQAGGFDGLIHWRGQGDVLALHGPGRSLDLIIGGGIAIDLPGHGLSDPWPGEPPTDWAAWQAVIDAVTAQLGVSSIAHEPLQSGNAALLFPDLTPDRYGHHLVTAWANVRAGHVFAPHYAIDIAHARPIAPDAMAPERLAVEHLSLIRAGAAARALHLARQAGSIA